MELIASSRIVKAQSRVEASRPYAEQLTKAMEDVASRSTSIDHPLLEHRESATKIGVLVITSDRGLAGAYNANVLKIAEQHLREIRARGMEPVLYVIGKKGVGYFRFRGVPMQASWQGFSEVPPYEKAEVVGRQLIQDFADETIDELHCTYTDFRSAFTLRATSKRFLPIAPEEVTGAARETVPAEYLFEPEPAEILEHLLPQYVVTKVYAVGVGRLGERFSPSRDEGRDRQRGRSDQDPDAAGEPGASGRDHDGDPGDRRRSRGAVLRQGRMIHA